jgi:hypothetical protein
LYRTESIFDPEDGTDASWVTQNVNEYSRIQVQTDGGYGGSINEIQFSHLMKESLGSVTDHGTVNIYNVNTQ